MSDVSAPVTPPDAQPSATHPRSTVRAGAIDALVVAVWFVVAGFIGALVWWQVTPLPTVVRSAQGATLSPDELVQEVGIDGWFFVVAAVGGLLSGVILLAWRRRDPLLMVALVVLGAGLASWLTVHVGLALGPEKVVTALRGAPVGTKAHLELKLNAPGMGLIWPIAAGLGALVYVWILKKPGDDH